MYNLKQVPFLKHEAGAQDGGGTGNKRRYLLGCEVQLRSLLGLYKVSTCVWLPKNGTVLRAFVCNAGPLQHYAVLDVIYLSGFVVKIEFKHIC